MPQVMANNANANVAAVNGQRPQRDPSPELRRPGCFGKLWCLGSSRKRGMRITPVHGTGNTSNAWASNGASSSTAANQFVGLSPSLLAPPSSPASFANSGNPSTVQSPASFTVSLCVPTANVVCSPAFDSTATMFTIGPYAHETTLVTPPAFSAFTTAPSTAPFTPPPELAHLTTPSSPDVPFAQLLASSLKNAKGASSGTQPASASPFASPDYVSRSCEMQTTYQMYPESPLASLISPASGISESGPPSPLPELEFPAAIVASNKPTTLSMRRITSAAFELAVKRPVELSTTSSTATATPQSESLNHSRELEPIKFLSPFMDYNDAQATIITTTGTEDDAERRQAELSVLEEWRLVTGQGSSNTSVSALKGTSPAQAVACEVLNGVFSLAGDLEYQKSSEDVRAEAVAGESPATCTSSTEAAGCEISTELAAHSSLPGTTSMEAATSSGQADSHPNEAATSLTGSTATASSSGEAVTDSAAVASSSGEAVTSPAAVANSSGEVSAAVASSRSEARPLSEELGLASPSGSVGDVASLERSAEAADCAARGQDVGEAAVVDACQSSYQEAGVARCLSQEAAASDLRMEKEEEQVELQQEAREGTGHPLCSKAVEPLDRCSNTSSLLVVELTVDDVGRLEQQHEVGTPKNGVNGFHLLNGYTAKLLTRPPTDRPLLDSNEEQQMKSQDLLV